MEKKKEEEEYKKHPSGWDRKTAKTGETQLVLEIISPISSTKKKWGAEIKRMRMNKKKKKRKTETTETKKPQNQKDNKISVDTPRTSTIPSQTSITDASITFQPIS